MPVFRNPQPYHFTFANPVEKHFHDQDETWVIMEGKCKAFMVDRDGARSEFMLEAGDIWMVEAGVEHGCEAVDDAGVKIFPFMGSTAEGSHEPGHYYMEKERYMPTLYVKKTPVDRYAESE